MNGDTTNSANKRLGIENFYVYVYDNGNNGNIQS